MVCRDGNGLAALLEGVHFPLGVPPLATCVIKSGLELGGWIAS